MRDWRVDGIGGGPRPSGPRSVRITRTWRRSSTGVECRVRGDRRRADRAEPAAVAGEIDAAPISSIEYARNADIAAACCRGSASRREGAVDSIQLITKRRSSAIRAGRGHTRVGDLGRADEGAAARRRACPARARRGRREAADRRRGAEVGVRGSDAASRPRPALARAHRACRWCSPSGRRPSRRIPDLLELEDALVESVRAARAEPELLAFEAAERYGYPAGFLARYFEKLRYRFGPRERAGLYTFLELARDVGELDEVPELRFVTAAAAV